MSDEQYSHRKVYAKGYYDGIEAAQSQGGVKQMMSESRKDQLYKSMSSIAKKVYDAIPMQKAQQMPYITQELSRVGNTSDHRVVNGAINTLIDAGLVAEPIKGYFIREKLRAIEQKEAKKEAHKIEELMSTNKPSAVPPALTVVASLSPIDRMGELSGRLSIMADALKDLAMEINNVAVDIEVDVEAKDASAIKLKQLQTILQSLG